jgi:hypothetical protein
MTKPVNVSVSVGIRKNEGSSSHFQPGLADGLSPKLLASSQSAKSATQSFPPLEEYPIEALGGVLGSVAREIEECVQCPAGTAGQSILAAGALAAQGHYDVEIDGRTIPLSLNCLTISESGERKSAADELALSPVHQVQKDRFKQFIEDQKSFDLEMDVYTHAKTQVLKKPGDQETLLAQTKSLRIPEQPREPILLSQEPTLEGLMKSFHRGPRSQGLFSDEGGSFFGGFGMKPEHTLKTISGFSKFWDGGPINRTRAGQGESFILDDVRLSSHLMIQPVVARLLQGNPLLIEQGYLARFLIVIAEPKAGTRFYQSKNPRESIAFANYDKVMQRLLTTGINENPNIDLDTLRLNREAMELWEVSYNKIERELGGNDDLSEIKPTASKMAENIARIAGVLAVFDDACVIEALHMKNAIVLGSYYLQQATTFVRNIDVEGKIAKAEELLAWLRKRPARLFHIDEVSNTPRPITNRSAPFTRELLAILVSEGWLDVIAYNTLEKPKEWRLLKDV